MPRSHNALSAPRLFAVAAVVTAVWACKENLPSGPDSFSVAMSVTAWSDTLVVGEAKTATAKTVDGASREIQGLHYTWTFADTSIARFTTDAANAGSSVVTALKPGAATATLALPDSRFVVSAVTKNLKVVIGGLVVASAHDTTLTAVNDTATVIAGSLVRVSGALVSRPGQGVKWTKKGPGAVAVVGTSDTLRVIAIASGVDTLIVTHDYCLAGARCADTVYARVRQTLKLALSTKAFTAWTFGDTTGPGITFADRRGFGNALASIRLVPVTAADSALVSVTATLGTTNVATGAMAAPKMVSAGNGTARVAVVGRNPDGTTADSDTVTYVIRQIAVRSGMEPLTLQMTEKDTVPVKAVARDARGFLIGDATLTNVIGSGLDVTSGKLTVTTPGTAFTGFMSATVSGVALAASNTGAPATTVAIDTATVTVLQAITFTADAANRAQAISLALKAPGGGALASRWVRWLATAGSLSVDSVLSDASGIVAVTWTPTTTAGRQVLTGLLRPASGTAATADSSGFIVVRRSVTIAAGFASPANSTISIRTDTFILGDTATVIVRVRDAHDNMVTAVTPADVAMAVSGGSLGAVTCSAGVCSTLYTATVVGVKTIGATLGGIAVTGSPLTVVVSAGAPVGLAITTAPVAPGAHNGVFATQPVVQVVNANGYAIAASGFTITAAKNDVVAGAVLVGPPVVTNASGVAAFTLSFAGSAVGTSTITITFSGTDGTTVLTPVTSGNVINPP